VPTEDVAKVGITDACGFIQYCREHRLQIAERAAYNPKYIGGSRLLVQRLSQVICALSQLVEQPGILDGDDCLSGEILYQRDLLLSEGAGFLAGNPERTDYFVVLQHRHNKQRSPPAEVDGGDHLCPSFKVTLLFFGVGDVNNRFGRQHTAENMFRTW